MGKFEGLEQEVYNATNKRTGLVDVGKMKNIFNEKGFDVEGYSEVIELLIDLMDQQKVSIFAGIGDRRDMFLSNPFYFNYDSPNETVTMLFLIRNGTS